MVAKAEARYIRVAPLKARQVINLIRGKRLDEALAILANLQKRSSVPVRKLLESALSNAQQQTREITPRQLVVADIQADQGPMMKRFRAGTMGRAMPILKRTTHFKVVLQQGRRVL
ncbi:MAG: 50S ribosomal protein L22 [Candidatus Omnitrophica bacterium]|nr:50S ribosomal protein L22 [Candidatus Omnitrophota bacterium]